MAMSAGKEKKTEGLEDCTEEMMKNPGSFLKNNVICVPEEFNDMRDVSIQHKKFCIIRKKESGICYLSLSTTERGLNGIFISQSTSLKGTSVVPELSPPAYFIFTNRLGGCSVGISPALQGKPGEMTFLHTGNDREEERKKIQEDYPIKLLDEDLQNEKRDNGIVDDESTGFPIQTTAVGWWDGKKWNLQHCPFYETNPNEKKEETIEKFKYLRLENIYKPIEEEKKEEKKEGKTVTTPKWGTTIKQSCTPPSETVIKDLGWSKMMSSEGLKDAIKAFIKQTGSIETAEKWLKIADKRIKEHQETGTMILVSNYTNICNALSDLYKKKQENGEKNIITTVNEALDPSTCSSCTIM